MKIIAALAILMCVITAHAQQPANTTAEQVAAMKNCAFLEGQWAGEGWMYLGPDQRRTFQQSETVRSRLDGLLLEIEGVGKDGAGKVVHHALALLSFDARGKQYRFRSYDGMGHYIEADAACKDGTMTWSMAIGPRQNRYTIKLNSKGQWSETGESSADGQKWQPFFEMTLNRLAEPASGRPAK